MGPKRTFQHGGPTPPPLWAGRSPPRPARPGSGCPGRSWPRVRSGARDSEDLVRCGGRGRCCAAGPGELVRGAGRVGPTEPAAPRLRAGLELSSVPCPRRAGRYRPLPRSLPQRGVTSSALKIAPARAALGVGRVRGSEGEGAAGGFPRFFSIYAELRCWLAGDLGAVFTWGCRVGALRALPPCPSFLCKLLPVAALGCAQPRPSFLGAALTARSAFGWRSSASAKVSRRAFLWAPLGGWQPRVPLDFV